MGVLGRTICAALALCSAVAAPAAGEPHYSLRATLEPASHGLSVQATIDLPAAAAARDVEFLLATPLEIVAAEPAVEKLPIDGVRAFAGINGSSAAIVGAGRAARYRVHLPSGVTRIALSYRGKIDFTFDSPAQEYARGFNETAGTIRSAGIYLAGSTLWYPYLGESLFTFDLVARGPAGWQLVSPGSGSARDATGDARWRSTTPVDELHIVGGELTRYARQAGAVSAEVFLRQPDDALAAKYLEATARNLEMYRTLIGPYPYDKFALVENFWETGYGMPSFTLLGPQIIRFPFILTSSYPHEILHNWWGNGVFVDYASGNWCEGLTAYLADHLYKEQQGQGAEYRRDTLKKYRDFVRDAQDFPLAKFLSRHSPSTEAVGYGKALMLDHMLRRKVGDAAYVRGLQRFYRERRGQRASFDDLARAHSAAASIDLAPMVSQWVSRTGAPELHLADVRVVKDAEGDAYVLRGVLRQMQVAAPFELDVPLVVRSSSGVQQHVVALRGKSTPFELRSESKPLGLEVDPEFDVFRLLDARETAPSLGQMFGDPEVLAVLPAKADATTLRAMRDMVDFWSGGGAQKIRVITDVEAKRLPEDRAVWIFGRNNSLAARLFASDAATGYAVEAEGLRAGSETLPFAGRANVIVRRHPGNPAKAIAWITLDSIAAAPGLARKLPHYGKYSWLAFAGDEPANVAKGEWSAADSPLHVDLRAAHERTTALSTGGYPRREALARLPAAFDGAAMATHVRWLADPAREGRGLGSAGLNAAAGYVADAFRNAGLQPVDAQGWFQDFDYTPAGAQKSLSLRNVVGVLRGSNPRYANQAIVVSAHYDHLGRNGPGVRMAEIGQIHPGADDNASGVAVLLELARTLAAAGAPERTILFVAFSGEEAGLQGSKWFVAHPRGVPLEGIRAVVNLDTVGRLGGGELSVLATGTASEWQHVFRGISFSTGIAIKNIPGAAQSSDQQSFIEHGIPGVQLLTAAHLDYHRPSDTADRIDVDGLVKVATVAREAVDYLAQRSAPLTITIERMAVAPADAVVKTGEAVRRVAFGLVPDYAHQGVGVRAESVVPDSPAARAGIEAGDLVLSIDGVAIAGLGAFSDVLKQHGVGDRIATRVRRAEREFTVNVELVAR